MREDWRPYYDWLAPRLDHPGRWAVIPDAPGAPSQLNDGLLNDWPYGSELGAPLYHMDAPVDRLLRLCDRFARVCIGWTGTGKDRDVGCAAWYRRMDEIAAAIGNQWPNLHMMRGVLVAREFPFTSADATSGAQNGHRYDSTLDFGDKWSGRRAYLDRLELGHFPRRVRSRLQNNRREASRRSSSPDAGQPCDQTADQLGLW